MILSKDSFEHYDDPEHFITTIAERLNPGGELVIGFGPLWKSPTGGHINYMTPLPWAHLLFSENVIMAERRRFRPQENARRWSEVRGGLNLNPPSDLAGEVDLGASRGFAWFGGCQSGL
jgi:hypothetical protein